MTNSPYDTDTPIPDEATEQLARDLYEHVRLLNYATDGTQNLTRPSTAYTVLGNLSAAAYGLDQTLGQLNRFLLREFEAGRLGHDQGEDLDAFVQAHDQAIAEARQQVRALSQTLSHAQTSITGVHGPVTTETGNVAAVPDGVDRQPATPEPGRSPVEVAAADFPVPITEALRASRPGQDGGGGPAGQLPRNHGRGV